MELILGFILLGILLLIPVGLIIGTVLLIQNLRKNKLPHTPAQSGPEAKAPVQPQPIAQTQLSLSAHKRDIREAEKALSRAERDYQRRITDAQKELGSREKAHQKALRVAEKHLKTAQISGDIATIGCRTKQGRVELSPKTLFTPQGEYEISNDLRATVDTAGNLASNSRTTLTRIAAGGFLAGPVGAVIGATARKRTTQDTRELYLLIESEQMAEIYACDPNDGEKVRRVAIAINNAAKNLHQATKDQMVKVSLAQGNLNRARSDTATLDAAKEKLAEAQKDNVAVLQARRQLETIRGQNLQLPPA